MPMDIWKQEDNGGGSREHLARLFGDLSHPLRLAVVMRLIAVGRECVCSLARAIEVDQPTLSRHLRILKDHGVVGDRRRGAKVFYRVIDPRVVAILNCRDIFESGAERMRTKQEES